MRIQQPKRENKPHHRPTTASRGPAHTCGTSLGDDIRAVSGSPAASRPAGSPVALRAPSDSPPVVFYIESRRFLIRDSPRPATTYEQKTGGADGVKGRVAASRSERTLDAVEHSRTLMEWWPFLIFHRGGLRIKVINNTAEVSLSFNVLMHVHTEEQRQRSITDPRKLWY